MYKRYKKGKLNLFTHEAPKSPLLRNSIQRCPCILGRIKNLNVGFCGWMKIREPGQKTLKTLVAGKRTNNKLNPHARTVSTLGINLSALTTAPSLHIFPPPPPNKVPCLSYPCGADSYILEMVVGYIVLSFGMHT